MDATNKTIFISHSSRDAEAAKLIVAALESSGVPCWIAPRDIVAGSDWNDGIMAGLNGCALMLLLVSRHSVESDPVKREVLRAVSRPVPVIQVRLEEVPLPPGLQYMLSNLQWVTAHPPPVDRHLETIVAEVRKTLSMPAVPARPADAQPQYVGPYRLLEKLGEGGMGAVFKADQRSPVKRTVALKLIKPGFDTAEVIARFESERQALARMDHPHIAKVFEAGVDNRGRPFFAMEYVPGEPITQFADAKKLSIKQRLELFIQVCDAISHAHTKAIIHRDIKASNVLAYLADGKPTVKVIDFGIAKALTGDRLTDRTFNTDRGAAIGTYESMSPEQADGSPDIDTRTDVYSLGVLLYELLSGAKPFDAETLRKAADDEARRIIREVEAPRPSTRLSALGAGATVVAKAREAQLGALSRQLRSELEWIPLKALRKDRARRYASPLQLAEDIQNYLDGKPLIAGPESMSYRVRKALRRNRAAATTAATFILVGTIAVGVYIHTIRTARKNLSGEQTKTIAALTETRQQRDEANRLRIAADDERAKAKKQEEEATKQEHRANETLAKVYEIQGDRAFSEGKLEEAAVYRAEAYKLTPHDPSVQFQLGEVLRKLDAGVPIERRGPLLWRSPEAGDTFAFTFSPDGNLLLATSPNESASGIWNAQTGRLAKALEGKGAFSSDGKFVLLVADGQMFGRPVTISVLSTDHLDGAPIYSVKNAAEAFFSGDASRLIVRLASCEFQVIDLVSRLQLCRFSPSFTPENHDFGTPTVTVQSPFPEGKPVVISFSPNKIANSNGDRIAFFGGQDKDTEVWDGVHGRLLYRIKPKQGTVFAFAFDQTGKWAATARFSRVETPTNSSISRDRPTSSATGATGPPAASSQPTTSKSRPSTEDGFQVVVELWPTDNIHTAVELLRFTPHRNGGWGGDLDGWYGFEHSLLGFSPDGTFLQFRDGEVGRLVVWKCASRAKALELPAGIAVAPDYRFALGAHPGRRILLWSVEGGSLLGDVGDCGDIVRGAFRRDGGGALLQDEKGSVTVLDAPRMGHDWEGNLTSVMRRKLSFANVDQRSIVTVSPNFDCAVVGRRDGLLRVVDLEHSDGWRSRFGSRVLKAVNPDRSVAVLRDEARFGNIELRNLRTGRSVTVPKSERLRLIFRPEFLNTDSQLLAAFNVETKKLQFIDWVTGATTSTVEANCEAGCEYERERDDRNCMPWLTCSSDGRRIALIDDPIDRRRLRLIDVASGKALLEITSKTGYRSATFSPDDSELAIVESGKGILFYKIPKTTWLPEIALADTKYVVYGSGGRMLLLRGPEAELWDCATRRKISTFRGVLDAVFSPDGRRILTSSNSFSTFTNFEGDNSDFEDDASALRNSEDGRVVRNMPPFNRASFSHDSKLIAIEAYDNYWFQTLDADTGKEVRRFRVDPEGSKLTFSPSGRVILLRGSLFDVATGRLLGSIPGWMIDFTADESAVITNEGIREIVRERRDPKIVGAWVEAHIPLSFVEGQVAPAPFLAMFLAEYRYRRLTLNDGIPSVMEPLNALATAFTKVESFPSEHETILRDVIDIERQELPPGHPDIAEPLMMLAMLLKAQGNIVAAERTFGEVLDIYRHASPRRQDLALRVNHSAVRLLRRRESVWAEALDREALDIFRHEVPPDPLAVANACSGLGRALAAQRKYADAEPYLREALAIRSRMLGFDQAFTKLTANPLADLLDNTNRSAEAAQIRAQCKLSVPATKPTSP